MYGLIASARTVAPPYLSSLTAKGRVSTPVQRLPTATRKSGSSPSASTGVTTTMYAAPPSCTATSPSDIAPSSQHPRPSSGSNGAPPATAMRARAVQFPLSCPGAERVVSPHVARGVPIFSRPVVRPFADGVRMAIQRSGKCDGVSSKAYDVDSSSARGRFMARLVSALTWCMASPQHCSPPHPPSLPRLHLLRCGLSAGFVSAVSILKEATGSGR
jgi:hypothetical protein